VLFIDDNEFDIVTILRREGWTVDRTADVESFTDASLVAAHVIFIDIHGVGVALKFESEGLGLALAIKKSFPEKLVVVYSSEREGDRFHPALSVVDGTLPKDAEPFRFLQLVEELAAACFTFDKCVARIHKLLEREMGENAPPLHVLSEEINKAVIGRKTAPGQLATVLSIGLDKAASVASIVSLFVGGGGTQ